MRVGLACALCVAVMGCAGGQPRGPSKTVIDRALASAPGAAQPSSIVATELAYARTAREDGLDEARAEFAAPGAVLHRAGGIIPFAGAPIPDGLAKITEWGPRLVVKSCDGSLALSLGRLRDARGLVGTYVTVWQRQRDGSFKWTYDVSGRDDPQPAPRPKPKDGDIVVTALNAIEGLIATCPRTAVSSKAAAGSKAAPPTLGPAEANAQTSADKTLRWGWHDGADGSRHVRADYWSEGQWTTAIDERFVLASGE